MRMSQRLAAVTGLTAIAVAVAAPAEAHTALAGATPAKGSTVPSPARIALRFTEPVRLAGVVVLDDRGGHHESGKARAAGTRVTEQVAGVLTPGVYTVGWRVVAEDGHPVSGDYRFTVAARPSPDATGSSPASAPASVPAASPAARSERQTSGIGWGWVGLGAVLVAALGGGVALLRRR